MKSKVFVVLSIIMTMIIWLNSLMPASVSSEQSGFIVGIINSVFEWIGISIDQSLLSVIVRKLAHFLEFTVLGFLFFNVHFKVNNRKNMIFAISLGIVIAIIDECIQIFVDGRAFMITDIGIDSIGVIVGSFIGLLICIKYKRKNKYA
ncbi:MAG: VanZ family protein [Bacillota bacterium]